MAVQLDALSIALGARHRSAIEQSHSTRWLGFGVNESDDWRYVLASVVGVAHLNEGIGCQDACATQLLLAPELGPVLVLAVADGAGSAALSDAGAVLACNTWLSACVAWLMEAPIENWTPAVASPLFQQVRNALERLAIEREQPLREFACTLLGAVVTTDRALFLQIGDGAIVIGDPDAGYRPVFWPQSGEYANETHFVTDPQAKTCFESTVLNETIAEVALLSDGLQRLALHYRSRQAHEPFFRPLFQRLREHPEPGCPEELVTALERLLASPMINERTHDDKTLILASRYLEMEASEDPESAAEIDPTAPATLHDTAEQAATDSSATTVAVVDGDVQQLSTPEPEPRQESGDKAV
ncbi:MAG: protein phosphatase 2C domain-containing protein [Phycisphaerales bacterium]|nr:protein phosphatase 2C domain-containing protein [Phycisphaerales bacterium]